MQPLTTKGDVFISWVREDAQVVKRLASDLAQLGLTVWLDRTDIRPGEPWETAIRSAIIKGCCFVACFSKNYEARDKTYMEEELAFAVEIRYYQGQKNWLIPVLLSRCEIPKFYVAPSQMLSDLNVVDLTEDWTEGVQRIAKLSAEIHIRSIPNQLERYHDRKAIWKLRSEPAVLTDQEVTAMIYEHNFYERDYNPSRGAGALAHLQFLDNYTETIALDLSTGLLWHVDTKHMDRIPHRMIPEYLSNLNRQLYGGVDRWRLPTLPEAMSLIEIGGKHDHRFGFPIAVWTADMSPKGSAWIVGYINGDCGRIATDDFYEMSVRAVCSWLD